MAIMAQMKDYDYSKYTASRNSYGENTANYTAIGTINIAINLSNQSVGNNIYYSEADYIGLTKEEVDDTYIIHYGNEKLKVKYVNPIGRYKQVALVRL